MTDKPLNVLVLEDSKTDEVLIRRYLQEALPNSIVMVARNKSEFLEKAEWSVPDLVLSDYRLPDMNGLEALLHLRQKKSLVPFIFVTGALQNEEEAANAILQGASGFILKKNIRHLPEKIQEVLSYTNELMANNAKEERRRRELSVSLQKAMSMLEKAPHFEDKDEIRKILGEVLEII